MVARFARMAMLASALLATAAAPAVAQSCTGTVTPTPSIVMASLDSAAYASGTSGSSSSISLTLDCSGMGARQGFLQIAAASAFFGPLGSTPISDVCFVVSGQLSPGAGCTPLSASYQTATSGVKNQPRTGTIVFQVAHAGGLYATWPVGSYTVPAVSFRILIQ